MTSRAQSPGVDCSDLEYVDCRYPGSQGAIGCKPACSCGSAGCRAEKWQVIRCDRSSLSTPTQRRLCNRIFTWSFGTDGPSLLFLTIRSEMQLEDGLSKSPKLLKANIFLFFFWGAVASVCRVVTPRPDNLSGLGSRYWQMCQRNCVMCRLCVVCSHASPAQCVTETVFCNSVKWRVSDRC